MFLLKICLRLIASKASEEQNEKTLHSGHKQNIGPRPLNPLVNLANKSTVILLQFVEFVILIIIYINLCNLINK